MLHIHEVSRAVQADRDREIRERLPKTRGLSSGHRHPELPDSGIVEPGVDRVVLRREPKAAFGM